MPGPHAKSIPLFPPFCVAVIPETECTFLGITFPCVPAITEGTAFSEGSLEGHVWSFFVIFLIGIVALSYVAWPWRWKDSMKVLTGLYSLETAFFAVFRYFWGLGTPLLIGAALHNLLEWYIIIHLMDATRNFADFRRAMRLATYFILTVISLSVMIPGVKSSFLVEQTTGLMLDWAMPLIFIGKIWTANCDEVRHFYRFPAIAHTIHLLLTILPLVFANFHVGYVSWYSSFFLEVAIYLSAPITHILYCVWAMDFDRLNAPDSQESPLPDTTNGLPENYRIKHVWKYLSAGFSLGLITLFFVPFILWGKCPDRPECVPNGHITGISVATVHPGYGIALEDLVATDKLVETARKAAGNMEYNFVKNVWNPNEYRFIEKWESRAHLQAWLDGYPKGLFSSDKMKGLLVGEKVHNTAFTTPISSLCRSNEEGAITFNVTGTCEDVWKVVGNWKDCSWVMGCTHADVDPSNPTGGDLLRVMHMEDGQVIHAYRRSSDEADHSLIYQYTSPKAIEGYIGTVLLQSTTEGGCTIFFKFSIPRHVQMTVALDYHLLYDSRLPFLKEMFQGDCGTMCRASSYLGLKG